MKFPSTSRRHNSDKPDKQQLTIARDGRLWSCGPGETGELSNVASLGQRLLQPARQQKAEGRTDGACCDGLSGKQPGSC